MKRIAKPLGAMLFGLVWALIIAEVGARILAARGTIPSRMPADLFAAHAIGWTMQPNLKATVPSSNGLIRIEINGDGFRDQRYPAARGDQKRVLVLGDSYVAAIETPQEATFHTLMEDGETEVIAMGVSGYQPTQELLAYDKIGSAYAPDDVVLMLYIGNDLLGNSPREDAPYYTADESGRLELHNYPWQGDFQIELVSGQRSTAIMQASELAFMIGVVTQKDVPHVTPAESNPPPREAEDGPTIDEQYCGYLTIANYSVIDDASWAIDEAILLALRDAVEEDGGTFRVVIIPAEFQVQADEEAAFLNSCPRPETIDAPPTHQHLSAFFKANDIPFLDLRDALVEARLAEGQPMYNPGIDNHLTEAGHAAVAEAISAWLANH